MAKTSLKTGISQRTKTSRKSNKSARSNLHGLNKSKKNKYIYSDQHYQSNDGMLTSVWGPSTWHMLHTMSFNYPIQPSCDDKSNYMNFVLSLETVLPCGKCRANLKKNFKRLPLKLKNMESRHTFSLYIYKLHEVINTMLNKKSGLSFEDVRERYEHFRARCKPTENDLEKLKKASLDKKASMDKKISLDKKASMDKKISLEKGCTEPIHGYKAKCILKIVPDETKCETFQIT